MIKNATKPAYFPENQESPCENNKLQAQVCFRTWRSGFVAGIAFWFDASFGNLVRPTLAKMPGGHPKRKRVFEPSMFRSHVSFREGN